MRRWNMRRPIFKRKPIREVNKRNRKIKIFIIIAVLFGLLIMIDNQMRSMIQQIASNRARKTSILAINEAIEDVISNENITYYDMVSINKLTDGEISSITTDIYKVNTIKAKVNTAIQNKMTEADYATLGIRAGTLTGSELLTGRGPRINVKVTLHGNVFTDLESKFSDAGINQTHHQLMLNVRVSIFVELPGYNTSTEVKTNFCIAETVIVGRVPDSFTSVNGDDSSLINKANDYSLNQSKDG